SRRPLFIQELSHQRRDPSKQATGTGHASWRLDHVGLAPEYLIFCGHLFSAFSGLGRFRVVEQRRVRLG
ncbi:MAG TPA: hypothetical protein VH592_00425, partial [Gemmataceae bacterium]